MWKYDHEGFFHLTYVETKHQSDEYNWDGAKDVQCLIWIFWVCQLSPTWYNVDCSQCLELITINFNWSTQWWSIVQQEISSMKLCKPLWHIQSVTVPSSYTTNLFLHHSCIFINTILEIIKHNMLKCCFFFYLQFFFY